MTETKEVEIEIIHKHELKYDALNECYYAEDINGNVWYIFEDNMFYVNDEHTYLLYKIKGTEQRMGVGVLMETTGDIL